MLLKSKAMRLRRLVWMIVLLNGIIYKASSQEKENDTLFRKNLEEVVFTATRTERKLTNVAVPVTIVSKKTIQQAGSVRLKDILQEQTGTFITNGFGAGIQMQGLSSDYTLILLDGEPLVGRTAGVLDLNRVTVGNIKKVEIVKGPSSSLYGSEAMAGVVNIITDRSYNKKLDVGFRYGTYNTIDANLTAGARIGKLGVNGFLNSYSTDGYSIRPSTVLRAELPIWRITPQLNLNYPLGDRTSLNLGLRYNYEKIKNELVVSNNGQLVSSKGKEINKDININPSITHKFSQRWKSSLRLYGTQFEGSQQLLVDNGQGYDDYFRQRFYRAETQTDYEAKNISLVGGAGIVHEEVNSTRYDDKENTKKNQVIYGFLQSEWQPLNKLTLIGGIRYDDNKLYASAFSPKIAAKYNISERFSLQGSYGKGFKAPDFRQLYLNFTNTAAGSYSVYGALEARTVIEFQDQQGLIKQLEPDYYRLADLRPEYSNGINFGFTAWPAKSLLWKVNFFRNDITDLIESRQVAIRQDNSQIFSYINVRKAYTQGLESEIQYQVNKTILVSGGYQFLLSADKEELDKIKQGNYYYTRDANNHSVLLTKKDYYGLPNRSRHMANLKFNYENEKNWFGTARAIFRSKWVVFDKDGNGIYNKQDEFADGFVLINLSAGKSFQNGFRVQAGVDNLLNYVDETNLPNMPGRSVYASIAYSFIKNKKQ